MLSNAWRWALNSLVPRKIQQQCKKMQKVRESVLANATVFRLRVLMEREKIVRIAPCTATFERLGTEQVLAEIWNIILLKSFKWKMYKSYPFHPFSLNQHNRWAEGCLADICGKVHLHYWPVGSQDPELVGLLGLMIFHPFSCCRKRMPTWPQNLYSGSWLV